MRTNWSHLGLAGITPPAALVEYTSLPSLHVPFKETVGKKSNPESTKRSCTHSPLPVSHWGSILQTCQHTCKLSERSYINSVFQAAEMRTRPLTVMHANHLQESAKKVQVSHPLSPLQITRLGPWDLQYQAHYTKAHSKHRCSRWHLKKKKKRNYMDSILALQSLEFVHPSSCPWSYTLA